MSGLSRQASGRAEPLVTSDEDDWPPANHFLQTSNLHKVYKSAPLQVFTCLYPTRYGEGCTTTEQLIVQRKGYSTKLLAGNQHTLVFMSTRVS